MWLFSSTYPGRKEVESLPLPLSMPTYLLTVRKRIWCFDDVIGGALEVCHIVVTCSVTLTFPCHTFIELHHCAVEKVKRSRQRSCRLLDLDCRSGCHLVYSYFRAHSLYSHLCLSIGHCQLPDALLRSQLRITLMITCLALSKLSPLL